jgi:predicted Fe-S protein YdhL (DUF1289 family)
MTSVPVPSPCIDVCRIDARTGLCEGCLRTLDEIAAWSALGDDDKRSVWALLDERRQSADHPEQGLSPSKARVEGQAQPERISDGRSR